MSALELADNLFQIVTLGGVTALAMFKGQSITSTKALYHLACATMCVVLGDLFWTLYFVIYGEFPYYFSSADLCFIGMYITLIGLGILLFREKPHHALDGRARVWGAVAAVVVLAMNAVCYWLVGGLLWTLAYAVPLAMLAYVAVVNVFAFRKVEGCAHIYWFHWALVWFVFVNNMMFVVSSMGYNNWYIFFDFCMTCSFPLMFYCLCKEGNP